MEALNSIFLAEQYLKEDPQDDLEVETPDCILLQNILLLKAKIYLRQGYIPEACELFT